MILEIRNSAIFSVAVMGLVLAGKVQAASGDGGVYAVETTSTQLVELTGYRDSYAPDEELVLMAVMEGDRMTSLGIEGECDGVLRSPVPGNRQFIVEGDTSGHCVIIADYRASFRHSGRKIELKFIKTGKVIELENGTH